VWSIWRGSSRQLPGGCTLCQDHSGPVPAPATALPKALPHVQSKALARLNSVKELEQLEHRHRRMQVCGQGRGCGAACACVRASLGRVGKGSSVVLWWWW
jgi:hypothetical protein